MSWYFNNVGSKEDVIAAINEAVAVPNGMPAPVGDYLKEAVGAVTMKPGAGVLVRVESMGHRPMEAPGGAEVSKVELVKNGPRLKP